MKARHISIVDKSLINENETSEKKVVLNDGVIGQYVDLGNSIINNKRGVGIWFKPLSGIDSGTAYKTLFSKWNSGTGGQIEISFLNGNGGKLRFGYNNGSGFVSINSDRIVWKSNRWYHVLCQIDSTRGMEMFVNAVKQSETNVSTNSLFNSSDNFYIGGYVGINSRYLDCDIKQFKIYSSGLTQEEVISELTYKPTGLESYISEYIDFEDVSGGLGTGVNGTSYSIVNPSGSGDELVFDTPITDYYRISLESSKTESINMGNSLFNGLRLIQFKFTPINNMNSSTPFVELLSRRQSGASGDIYIFYLGAAGGNKFRFASRVGTSYIFIDSDPIDLVSGVTYDIAFSLHSSTGRASYINGFKQNQTNVNTNPTDTVSVNTYFGGSVFEGVRYIDGAISNINLWNLDKSDSEILENVTKLFDGSELGLVFYARQLQGEKNKIYDFKNDSEGVLLTSDDVNNMWEIIN